MRYTDGTKNNDVTAVVRADGLDCPELRRSSAGSSGQCWIAVKSGQAITVFCDIKLESSQYQVDLVIDGVLRNIVVSTVCPRNEDREEVVEFFEGNHKYFRSLFRSPIITSRIPEREEHQEPLEFDDSDNTRVGTIEVLVYKYDMGYNHTRAAELPENVIDWEDLEGPSGCSGIRPTHEVVLANGKRLNDTERRTWKNKSEKLPMGHEPWAYFKFLYRHETTLRGAELIDPHRNPVPSAAGLSKLKKGLLTFATAADAVSENARFNNNPWVVRERNGLRNYKQLEVTPSKPGPQIISAKRGSKRPRDPKKGKKPANPAKRRSSRLNEDIDFDSANDSSEATPSKRARTTRARVNINGLRTEVDQLQAERDEAHSDLEELSKSGAMELNPTDERALLMARKEALLQEINYINLKATKYKERHALLEELNNATESADTSDDPMLIDPALLTPELASGSADGSISDDAESGDLMTDREYLASLHSDEQQTCHGHPSKAPAKTSKGLIGAAALGGGVHLSITGATASQGSHQMDHAKAVDAATASTQKLVIMDYNIGMTNCDDLASGEASKL